MLATMRSVFVALRSRTGAAGRMVAVLFGGSGGVRSGGLVTGRAGGTTMRDVGAVATRVGCRAAACSAARATAYQQQRSHCG